MSILLENYLNILYLDDKYDYVTEEYLIEAFSSEKLTKFVKEKLNWIEKELKTVYSVNTNRIKTIAKKQAELLKKEFNKGTPPEKLGPKIANAASVALKRELKSTATKIKEMSLTKQIVIAVIAFLCILYLNTLIGVLLSTVISNPVVLMRITTIIVAPAVEEAVKNYFIAKNMPYVGTGIVFGLEALFYIIQLIFSGAKVIKTLILRIATIMMHMATVFIQKKIIEKGEAEDKDMRFIAWATGVGIHALWNTLALMINNDITAWIMK